MPMPPSSRVGRATPSTRTAMAADHRQACLALAHCEAALRARTGQAEATLLSW